MDARNSAAVGYDSAAAHRIDGGGVLAGVVSLG